MKNFYLPKEIGEIIKKLKEANFQAYLVGGCVRDILLAHLKSNSQKVFLPKDWDIATDALPQEVQKIFPESVYENEFGTVGVKVKSKDNSETQIVEITTFRQEIGYSDKRHPDKIIFAKSLKEDLKRRDFTINALALDLPTSSLGALNQNRKYLKVLKFQLIDLFEGEKDLKNKIIRAVGDPNERFKEDALRMLRAVRFAAQLDFDIENQTLNSIVENSHLLKFISKERIRDELIKMINTSRAAWAIQLLSNLKLLRFIIPELEEGIGVTQNKHHIYTVWEHNLRALDYAAKRNYSLEVRLASLLHDVGKPRTKRGEGPESTFYGHEYVGARMTERILKNLKFPREVVEKVTLLVKHHLFYYNVGEVTAAGVRRFLARVGEENVDDLLKVREADRIGSGVPKAFPYRLRHLKFMIEKVRHDPISPKQLKINGYQLMEFLKIKPGPRVGHILNALLEEVIEDPKKNSEEYLKKKALELNKLSDEELQELRKRAEKRKQEYEAGIEAEMRSKYKV